MPNSDESEDVRVGYQVAINLTNHEEQAMWNRSSAMLVANGIIIASIGLSLGKLANGDSNSTWILFCFFSIILALFGGYLCYLWRCLVARTYKKCDCWVQCAAELEKRLSYPVETLEKAKRLSDHGAVKVGENRRIVMDAWGKRYQIKEIARLMTTAFIVLYILLFGIGTACLLSILLK